MRTYVQGMGQAPAADAAKPPKMDRATVRPMARCRCFMTGNNA